ncbi:pyrokinin-1 receptor-like [Vespula squamosa]|uniref:Pyrokinin-1 receptor-like n=1 Tax=Vespula squamosa TaxID=30214 RepID=A0ABD2BMV6_VESSQ
MENTLSASLIPPTSSVYSTLKENLLPQLNCESCYHNHTTSMILTEESYSTIARRDSLYIVIPVTIIYVSIFITGTIGNISTCIVIARNKSMHTATNYYLFSLAVSDLLLLISGLPAEIYSVWYKYSYIFGEGFCVIRGLAAETSTNASVLTITAFTAERYVAICHPFLSQTMSKLSRAVKLILVIWLVALSFALPQALQFGVVRHGLKQEIVICTVKRIIIKHSFEISTFLFFIVPMSLITVLYILIGLKLRKSNMMKKKPGNGESQRSCRHYPGKNSRKVLKMLERTEKKIYLLSREKILSPIKKKINIAYSCMILVAVVVAFFICWAPFHVQRLIAIYGTNSEDHFTSYSRWIESLYLLMTYVSGVLYYVSTTINPILYNIMSNKFRVAFMETLSKSCRMSTLRQNQRFYSSLSRSQQRTVGSKIAATTGTGIAQDSIECSGNSTRDDSPRRSFQSSAILERPSEQTTELYVNEKTKQETKNSKMIRIKKNCSSSENKSNDDRSNNELKQPESTRYTTLKVMKIDTPESKWQRFFKWLPGLKHLKFPRRPNYSLSRDDDTSNVLNDNRQCEFSMTLWNIREGTEQDRVRM